MGSSTKVDSIVIDLTDANNEPSRVECDGFSLCGIIAKERDSDPKKYWPFSMESASLVDPHVQSDSLPPSSFLKWLPRLSRTRNIDADGTNDSGLPSDSRSIISTNGLNGSSSIIPSQSELNSPIAIDQEREMVTDIAGNDVVVNGDLNCERSQNEDQRDDAVVGNEDVNCQRSQDDLRGNAVVENEDVNCEISQQNDQTVNAVIENENVNCEISQKDDQTAGNALVVNEDVNCERSQNKRVTRSSKKVHPPPLRTYALRNKTTKKTVAERVGNKRAEKQPIVEQLAVTETAACVEDTEPEEPESTSLFIGGAPTRRARKVRTRRLADLSAKPNTRRVESSSRKEPVRGQKRQSPPASKKVSTAGAASGNASKSVDSNHGGTESTESGFDIDPIKGKKKNVRFQVDDEPDTDPEVDDEDDWNPRPPRAKRTKKVKISKNKRATPAIDPSNKASSSVQPSPNENETVPSSVQPSLNENETVPSPPREQRTEERVGTSLDDQLASEGCFKKPNPPVNNERQENNRMRRSGYVPVFGNPSIPSTGRGLGTGPGAIYFGSPSNTQGNTPPPTVAAGQSSVPQKDASIPNKGRGLGTGHGAIYLGTRNNNTKRSTPSSTQVVVPSTVPQKDSSIPNTGRGLGTGPGAIYFGRSRINNTNSNVRSTPPSSVVAPQSSVPQKDASVPNTGRGLRTGLGAIYLGGNNNQRNTPSKATAAQSSVPQKNASLSDRKGKGVMVQSQHETENTQNDGLPNKEVARSNNLPQEVPQNPKTPFLFDLNETYEENVTSLEDNTNAAREEYRVPVRSEQTPRQNSYRASSSVMPPPVQESRRSPFIFPGHNPQRMGNVPMASPYHHPSPSTYPVRRVPHQFRAPSPPVWASSMMPPQYHHHHHHLSPPAPFNVDYSSMFAQAPSSDMWNLSYLGASLLNQAMMSRMDPRFRSNPPVDHHGNFVFPPRHVHPVNQFNQLVELQRSHERTPAFPRTIISQGRFQQRRNVASSSNVSASPAENSSASSVCIVSRYPGEITDVETYMVGEEDLHVPERMAEFEDQFGPATESG